MCHLHINVLTQIILTEMYKMLVVSGITHQVETTYMYFEWGPIQFSTWQ